MHKTKTKLWSYLEAQKTVPSIQKSLISLREHYITVWHLFRKYQKNPELFEEKKKLEKLGDDGVRILKNINKLGIIVFENPLRGIALYPIKILAKGFDDPREAFLVYKDSREEIETFIFTDHLLSFHDLPGFEQQIPKDWKISNEYCY